MKKLIWLLLLGSAAAQLSRFDAAFPQISSTNTIPYLVASTPPNSPVLAVCNSPANAVPCTNYATTFTAANVACSNGAQDTPQPATTSSCQPAGDARGNIGFWAPAGTYDYTVCVGKTCYGPFTVVLGSTGSVVTPGGNDTDLQFNSAGSFGGDDNLSWAPPDGLSILNQTLGGLTVFSGPKDTGNSTVVSTILSATMDNTAPASITTLMGAQISANAGTPHASVAATDIIALQVPADIAANVTANRVTLLDIVPQLSAASGVTNVYGIHIENGWAAIPALGTVRPILVEDGISQFNKLQATGLQVFANNAAAIAGGLVVGQFYRTGADPDVVCIVH